jgi:hypothetical protein
MPRTDASSSAQVEELDRFYREGGLRAMASPHVDYQEATCPHPGCGHPMGWIDFEAVEPLVRAWWDGTGFAGRCPSCGGWIRITTRRKEAIEDARAATLPQLPAIWRAIAQFA